MTTHDPLPDAWHKMLAKLAIVQAERDALRAELEEARLEFAVRRGEPEGALAGWEWSWRHEGWVRWDEYGQAIGRTACVYEDTTGIASFRVYDYNGDGSIVDGVRAGMRLVDAAVAKAAPPPDFPISDTICGRWFVSTAVLEPRALAILGRCAQTGIWAEPDTTGVEVDLVAHTDPDHDAIRAMHARVVAVVTGLCDMGLDTRESIREALADAQSPVPHAR